MKSIAIGAFDGIHLAHQELIKKADGVLVIEKGYSSLTPGWKRALYTKKPTFFYYFKDIKNLTAKEFILKLKSDFKELEKIVVGYDFIFGKNRSADANTLKELFDGEVEVVDEIKIDGVSIHSRVIREAILNNKIEFANKMLGRFYRADGKEIKGLGLGSKELVPTINLEVNRYTLPKGVFATNIYFENLCNKEIKKYKGVTFIGNRVSVDNSFSVECHILEDFEKTKNTTIWIEFIKFIRENKKFNSLKELKSQIYKDIIRAKEILTQSDRIKR